MSPHDNIIRPHGNCEVEQFVEKLAAAISSGLREPTLDAQAAAYDAFVGEVQALLDEASASICTECCMTVADRLDLIRHDLAQRAFVGVRQLLNEARGKAP